MNCSDAPRAMEGFAGATAIETRAAVVTVRLAVPFTDPDAAVMVIEPAAMPDASPCEPAESLMVATAPFDELQ